MKGVQASAGGGWSLNESPSEKEGKSYGKGLSKRRLRWTLNESPSEKEGKYQCHDGSSFFLSALNESPSEKEGKCPFLGGGTGGSFSLNERPSEKEGKSGTYGRLRRPLLPSMKVPPKRKGNYI